MLRIKHPHFWPLAVIVLLFAASIGLRWHSFSLNPITDHAWTSYDRFNNLEVYEHEHYVGQVYDTNPVSIHKFAGYIGGGTASGFLLNKHNGSDGYPLAVYTSFPPTHFIVLYETLRLFGSDVSFFGIQIFSLGLHLICILLVYWLAWVLSKNKLVSVAVASVYIFSTGTLQYHMNVYWAHELLQPVFLGALILFVKRKGQFKRLEAFIFGLTMSIIAWTGMFAALGFALYGGYMFFKTKDNIYKNYAFMVLGGFVALLAIVGQVIWATGASLWSYFTHVSSRVSARTGGVQHLPLPWLIWLFVNDLLIDYGAYMIIAWTLAMIRRPKKFEWGVIFVAAFPIVESFLLLEHDEAYGFARLKWLVPVLVVLALCGAKYVTTRRRQIIFTVAIVLANLLHAGLYLVVF